MNITVRDNQQVTTMFKWKPAGRTPEILVSEMATSHLYNTLRMIWNHCAPEDLKLHPYRVYNFGPYYTADYMARAVRAIIAELLTRKDLTGYMLQGIEHMQVCIVTDARVFGRLKHEPKT